MSFRITKFLINNYYILYLSFSNTIYYILYTLLSFSELIFLAFFLFFSPPFKLRTDFMGKEPLKIIWLQMELAWNHQKLNFFIRKNLKKLNFTVQI